MTNVLRVATRLHSREVISEKVWQQVKQQAKRMDIDDASFAAAGGFHMI